MMERPTDPYDVAAWMAYYAAHPDVRRSVGAAGDDGEGGEEPGENAPADAEAGAETTAETEEAAKVGDGDNAGGKTSDQDAALLSDDGAKREEATSWRDGIDDPDLQKTASRYNSPADVVKALREKDQEISRRVKVPGKNASEDEVKAFQKAIGVPESPDAYTVPQPEHMDEETFKSDAVQGAVKSFTEAMHKAGAPQQAVEAAVSAYWEMEADAQKRAEEKQKEAREAADAALRKEWREDYDANMQLAKAFVSNNGGKGLEDLKLQDGTYLFDHPDFIRFAADNGRRIGEGTLQTGLQGTEAGQDLEKQIGDIETKLHAAHNRGDSAEADRLSKERQSLLGKLHGISE